jgi:glycosyltransferase involved in cell wall biosynthesis
VVRDPTRPGRLDVDGLAAAPSVRLVDLAVPVVSPAAQVRWPRLLADLRPDVLLMPYHLAAPWVHPGVPTVAFVHDCILEADGAYAPGGRHVRLAYRAATRLALARSSVVATISHATQRELHRVYGIALNDQAVVPHGVGEQFRALGAAPPSARNTRYVLHVGAHRPHKNHATLIAAFAGVARTLPDVRLVLVGQPDGRFPGAVADQVHSAGLTDRVDLRVDVDEAELLTLYRDASVFAFPSLVEGFGLPVLEAMAAGVPAVTSDAPAVTEAAGGASLVVPGTDVPAWTAALVRVLTDPALATALVARGRSVAADCTWDRAADRTLELLRVVGAPAAARRLR